MCALLRGRFSSAVACESSAKATTTAKLIANAWIMGFSIVQSETPLALPALVQVGRELVVFAAGPRVPRLLAAGEVGCGR